MDEFTNNLIFERKKTIPIENTFEFRSADLQSAMNLNVFITL